MLTIKHEPHACVSFDYPGEGLSTSECIRLVDYARGITAPRYPMPAIPIRVRYMECESYCSSHDMLTTYIEQLSYYKTTSKKAGKSYWRKRLEICVPITQQAKDYLQLPFGFYQRQYQGDRI